MEDKLYISATLLFFHILLRRLHIHTSTFKRFCLLHFHQHVNTQIFHPTRDSEMEPQWNLEDYHHYIKTLREKIRALGEEVVTREGSIEIIETYEEISNVKMWLKTYHKGKT